MKINTYSAKGVRGKSITLPKVLSGQENPALLAQAVHVFKARRHPGLSQVKTRGVVAGTTKKVWRQKGTGRARHGARTAPIFVGGGVAHGPDGKKRKLALPRKMRQKALLTAVDLKAREGKVVAVSNLTSIKKTKEAASLVEKIAKKEGFKKKNLLLAISKESEKTTLFFRNIPDLMTVGFKNLNAHEVFLASALLIDQSAIVKETKEKSIKKV